ncbi:helix-turn-helix domain-containing protein [Enterococcus sp. AZ072]|uniref:helix-turn-helix domain-containing protein n=1 Tax=unclassified Enterococcus TaxID=2608891 RepID=UPI003D29BE7F
MKIGEQLKQKRLENNWTQAEVAEELFVSARSISNWENGRNMPDIESLIRLARLYRLSLDELLMEGSEMVEDLKKKEQAAQLSRILFFGPIMTSTLLLILMFILPSGLNRGCQFLIVAAAGTNFVPWLYLKMKIDRLKGREHDWEKEIRNSKIIAFAALILILLFVAYLYTL